MNIKKSLSAITQWLLRFVQLQLFITLFSFPILLAWGLPISLLSPLGNLIFSPVLTVFLFISSLIFLCALLHIPHGLLIALLEKITACWLTIMHADCATWLMGFIKPSTILLALIPVIALLIMVHPKIGRLYTSIACTLAVLIGVTWYLHATSSHKPTLLHIPCNRGAVTLLQTNNQYILIDPGYIGQRTNAASWAQHTLLPELVKKLGCTTLDQIIALQPSNLLFQALEIICTKIRIKKIYIPYWDGDCPHLARSYCALKRTAHEKGIELVRLRAQPLTITVDKQHAINILPTDTPIKTSIITYPSFALDTFIDNEKFTLYSAKYAKKLDNLPNSKTTYNLVKT